MSTARLAGSALVTAAASVFGALILGEYDLAGFTPYVSGVLFGLVLAEVALTVAKQGNVTLAALTAATAAAGMAWAGWISTDHWRAPVPVAEWIGVALAAMVGFEWVRRSGRVA